MISFLCPNCNRRLNVKEELTGRKVKCPQCGQPAQVPAALTAGGPAKAGATLPSRGHGTADEPSVEPPTLPPSDAASKTEGTPRPSGLEGAIPAELYDFLAPPRGPGELGRLGPYRVLRVLGAGGMGVVFEAEDVKLKRRVALKAMLPSLAASASSCQRFVREARAAAAIEHDHIVTIYQVDEERGVPYLAMQFLRGESLESRAKREGRLPAAEVLRIGRETAAGLAAAHKRGLIHRDIKPANLWLEAGSGRVKILDFGLARLTGSDSQLTQQGAIVGTPAFMAPEQANGKPLDGRCDLFSLGCVLYRLATGRLPFKGIDTFSTLMAVVSEEPPAPIKVAPDVPRALSDFIMHLLAKEPADRPASAQAVVEALTALEQDRTAVLPVATVEAVPKKKPSRIKAAPSKEAPPPRRRSRWPVLVVLLGILGLGALALVGLLPEKTPSDNVADGSTPNTTRPPDTPPKSVEQPWVQLFNGQDLTGWRLRPKPSPAIVAVLPRRLSRGKIVAFDGRLKDGKVVPLWRIEKGVLISGGPTSHLFSARGDYDNFIIRAEVLINAKGNSGLYFRSQFGPGYPKGYEAQINLGPADPNKTGSLYLNASPQRVVPVRRSLHKPNEWFTLEVEARDRHVVIRVNGKQTVERELLEKDAHLRGHFALQQHDPATVVKFRKIEIKELPARP